MKYEKCLLASGASIAIVLLVSFAYAHDRLTWFMEVMPVMIAAPALWLTRRSFPLSAMLFGLIVAHALILILGGTYTYARVPLGFWLQDLFSLSRNPYDKIGHFAQGFVPAMVAREILVRGGHVAGSKMAAFLSICVAMAISAWYELVEWWAALALGQGADEFLGIQGDQWDTQSDMFLAFLGASLAMLLLARLHDRQMKGLLEVRAKGKESASPAAPY